MTEASHADRLTTVDESGRGTPADIWSGWKRRFPPLDLARLRDVVVVAPHPDDEVLGVGGLMADLVAGGARVRVVAVTDGDAAYPASPTVDPPTLARLRALEATEACRHLGVTAPQQLGLPDGEVRHHEDELVEHLAALLRPGVTCLSTWAGDGHPDHEATGRAAGVAARRKGSAFLTYPVWTWHWAVPDDPGVPWDRASVHSLSAERLQSKRAAVDCFATQIRPLSPHPGDAAVLPPFVVDRLVTPQEMVFR